MITVPRWLRVHAGEYEIERFSCDVRINAVGGGTSEILKEIVGRLMGI